MWERSSWHIQFRQSCVLLGKAVCYVTFVSYLDLTLLLCNVECLELITALGTPCTSFFKVCPIVYKCTSTQITVILYQCLLTVLHSVLPHLSSLFAVVKFLKKEKNNKKMVGWALLSRCFVCLFMTEHMSVSVTVTHFDLLAGHFSFPLVCKWNIIEEYHLVCFTHCSVSSEEQGYINYWFVFIHYSCNSAVWVTSVF
jgi:hypothetical protein